MPISRNHVIHSHISRGIYFKTLAAFLKRMVEGDPAEITKHLQALRQDMEFLQANYRI